MAAKISVALTVSGVAIGVGLSAGSVLAADDVAGQLVVLKKNAGWCWFQDPRVIYTNGKLVLGSIAGTTNGFATGGDAYVTGYDLTSKQTTQFFLRNNIRDDHNVPAFSVLPNGKILVEYAEHGTSDNMYWRVSNNAGDPSSFGTERVTDLNPANAYGTTYANPFYLKTPNRVINFSRTVDYHPNWSYYANLDGNVTHTYGGRMLAGASAGVRPYVKYASDGQDKIWFLSTEGHPRNVANSLYAGYVQFDASGAGKLYNSSGTLIKSLNTTSAASGAASPTAFTKVFSNGYDAATGGNYRVSWANDVRLDADNNPYAIFSARFDGVTTSDKLRYYFTRFDGTAWKTNFLAYAGSALYNAENDYAGLATTDPTSPDIVYLSANVDPATGLAVFSDADQKQHYELYKGVTADDGLTWTWEALTSDSTMDNVRPLATRISDTQTSLVWMRGTSATYLDYNTDLVGTFVTVPEPAGLAAGLASAALLLRRRAKA